MITHEELKTLTVYLHGFYALITVLLREIHLRRRLPA
jgi:hypothetical protein